MTITYIKGRDLGEDEDYLIEEERTEKKKTTVTALIKKLQEFLENHPNAKIDGKIDIGLCAEEDGNEIQMIITD